jgi:hypothetical protein
MQEAYKAAATLSRRLIERDKPQDAQHLLKTQVVIVRGCYDHGEAIFDLCEIQRTLIEPAQVAQHDFDPDQILYVNCPGEMDPRALEKVRSFVERGGMLVTTDWALKHVIEKGFPGLIAYNGHATADDVVRVVFEKVEDGFLDGLLDSNDDPVWWLEGSSYPIKVLDPSRVKTLVSSQEMGAKYGERPIVVAFEVGLGKIYHMTSHFYLQRAETRTARHRTSGAAYAQEKGVALGELSPEIQGCLSRTPLTQVQSAYTSARSVANMAIEQSKRASARKGLL